MAEARTRILWVSDGEAPTGFARVAHGVLSHLDKEKYEIHHLAINYRGDPHNNDWKLYPAMISGDLWGFGRFQRMIQVIRPHLIFILNDPWVIQRYLAIMIESKGKIQGVENIPVVVYFPVDAKEHDAYWFRDYAELVKKCCVYTNWGKDVVLETGSVNPSTIEVVPHGIDKDKFYKLPDQIDKDGNIIKTSTHLAREKLFPLDDKPEFLNSFIILNANRNQPRKRIDITLRAFAKFAQNKPKNVKLYLHMGTRDMGWDIMRLAVRYGFDERLAISANVPDLPNVPDDRLNLIYNACDVGVNSSMGEGWGLTSWEHAACGKPQIVPDHSVMPEIWGDAAIYYPTIADHVYEGTHTVGRVPSTDGLIEKLEWAYQQWKTDGKEFRDIGKRALALVNEPQFEWKAIADRFDAIFDAVMRNKNVNLLA